MYETGFCSWEGVNGVKKISDDRWHLLTAVMDGTKLRLFVDGNLDGEVTQTGNIFGGDSTVYIGKIFSGTDWYGGLVDEVRIYDQSLSSSEIKQYYAEGLKKYQITKR